jgi:hypothetical protein
MLAALDQNAAALSRPKMGFFYGLTPSTAADLKGLSARNYP